MELIIFLAFSSAVALGLGLSGMTRPQLVRQRLARLSRASARTSGGDAAGVLDDQGSWLLRLLGPFAAKATRMDAASRQTVRRRLIRAGYRKNSALVIYTGSRIALALALPALMLATPLVWRLEELQLIVLLCGVAAVGLVAPSYFVDRKASARQAQVLLGLPDSLDLLLVCIEAGLALQASIARVAGEFARTNLVLAEEFGLVLMEIRTGKSTADALRGLADRTGLTEVSTLAATLIQTERFGTSLGDTLRVHAEAMRVQRLQRAEEMAAKAPIKMLFPTLLIFIATLMIMIGPGVLQMFAFFAEN